MRFTSAHLIAAAGLLAWFVAASAAVPFVAFNDHVPGLGTATNVTTYGPGASGPLLDFETGATLPVQLAITAAATPNTIQGRPYYGTPASVVFDGIVDLAGYPFPALEMGATTGVVTYTFTGLDPAKEYNFQGTAIRGNINYSNRWTIFELAGAVSFTNQHTAGAVTRSQVASLTVNQVAINTGFNSYGELIWWEHIQPAANGTISVTSKRYGGALPGGLTASGAIGYGLTGIRLEERGVYSGRTNLPPRVAGRSAGGINGIKTIWMVVMENSDWGNIKGSIYAPYMNTLIQQGAYCEKYYNPPGLHPSLPNYLWLICGTNFGIQDDLAPVTNHRNSTNSLIHQLDAAGIPWRCYAEDITGTICPDTAVGNYAVRHVPFLYFDSVRGNLANCTNHVRPFAEVRKDLTNGGLARFNFLVPNQTNNMHDPRDDRPAAIKAGDTWLAQQLPSILNSAAFQDGGLMVITFDEGEGSTGDGPIGTILLSPRVRSPGYASTRFYDHSSMLRTLQDIYGVQPYLPGAVYANDMSELFKTIEFTSTTLGGGSLQLALNNLIPGRTNQLFQASSPTGPWVAVQTNIAVAPAQTLTLPVTGGPGFYRLRELP